MLKITVLHKEQCLGHIIYDASNGAYISYVDGYQIPKFSRTQFEAEDFYRKMVVKSGDVFAVQFVLSDDKNGQNLNICKHGYKYPGRCIACQSIIIGYGS